MSRVKLHRSININVHIHIACRKSYNVHAMMIIMLCHYRVTVLVLNHYLLIFAFVPYSYEVNLQGKKYSTDGRLFFIRFRSLVKPLSVKYVYIGLTPVNKLDYPRPHHKIVSKILK